MKQKKSSSAILVMAVAILIMLLWPVKSIWANTNAGTIKLDGTNYTGSTAYGNDIYYFFDLEQAGMVTLTCARENAASDKLNLVLVDRDQNDTILNREKGYIKAQLKPGRYAAVVYWTDCMDGNPTIDYTFSANFEAVTLPTNISVETATDMVKEQEYKETISKNDDYKIFYKITVAQESMLILRNPGQGFLSTLYKDATLTTVLGTMSSTFNNIYTSYTVQPGVYYMTVESQMVSPFSYTVQMDKIVKPEKLTVAYSINQTSGIITMTWNHKPAGIYRSYRVYKKVGSEWKLIDSCVPIEKYKYDNKISLADNGVVSFSGAAIAKGSTDIYSVVAVDEPNVDTSHDYNYTSMMLAGDIDAGAFTVTRPSDVPNQTQNAQVSLTKPVLVSVTNKASQKVVVKWNKCTNASSVQLQYATSKKFAAGETVTRTVKGSKTSVTLKGLTKKKTYFVRIKAINGKTESKWSKVLKVKIKK